MSTTNWTAIPKISDGDALDADTLNAPINSLETRTNILNETLSSLGYNAKFASIRMPSMKMDPSCSIGDFVYFDSAALSCKKAIASTDLFDPYKADEKSLVIGIVIDKTSSTSGTVASAGLLDFEGLPSTIDLASLVETGETYTDGFYYLSSREEGKITKNPGSVKVPLGSFIAKQNQTIGSYAILNPRISSELVHSHKEYSLKARPVGYVDIDRKDPTGHATLHGYVPDGHTFDEGLPGLCIVGDWASQNDCTYQITLSTNMVLSWTSDEDGSGSATVSGYGERVRIGTKGIIVFLEEGSAPFTTSVSWTLTFPEMGQGWVPYSWMYDDGSDSDSSEYDLISFVYSKGFDIAFNENYPSHPLSSASLIMNGIELSSNFSKGILDCDFVLTEDFIGWTSNVFGMTPWPASMQNRETDLCETEEITFLYRSIQSTQGSSSVVTSLSVKSGNPIKITTCGTDSKATTGDLEISLDMDLESKVTDAPGNIVVKNMKNGQVVSGPVVESVVSDAPMISAVSENGTVHLSVNGSGSTTDDLSGVGVHKLENGSVVSGPIVADLRSEDGWISFSRGTDNTAGVVQTTFNASHDNVKEIKPLYQYNGTRVTQSMNPVIRETTKVDIGVEKDIDSKTHVIRSNGFVGSLDCEVIVTDEDEEELHKTFTEYDSGKMVPFPCYMFNTNETYKLVFSVTVPSDIDKHFINDDAFYGNQELALVPVISYFGTTGFSLAPDINVIPMDYKVYVSGKGSIGHAEFVQAQGGSTSEKERFSLNFGYPVTTGSGSSSAWASPVESYSPNLFAKTDTFAYERTFYTRNGEPYYPLNSNSFQYDYTTNSFTENSFMDYPLIHQYGSLFTDHENIGAECRIRTVLTTGAMDGSGETSVLRWYTNDQYYTDLGYKRGTWSYQEASVKTIAGNPIDNTSISSPMSDVYFKNATIGTLPCVFVTNNTTSVPSVMQVKPGDIVTYEITLNGTEITVPGSPSPTTPPPLCRKYAGNYGIGNIHFDLYKRTASISGSTSLVPRADDPHGYPSSYYKAMYIYC